MGQRRAEPNARRALPHSYLDEFNPVCCKQNHAQQEQTMFPALNIGCAIGSFAIPNGQINDF